MRNVAERNKGIALARRVGFLIVSSDYPIERMAYRGEKSVEQFGSIWDEMLVILIDGVDSEDGILSDERVSVFLSSQCEPHFESESTYKA